MFDGSFDVSKLQEIAKQVLTKEGDELFARYLIVEDYEMAQIVLLAGIDRCFLLNKISRDEATEALQSLDLSVDEIKTLRASKHLRLVA